MYACVSSQIAHLAIRVSYDARMAKCDGYRCYRNYRLAVGDERSELVPAMVPAVPRLHLSTGFSPCWSLTVAKLLKVGPPVHFTIVLQCNRLLIISVFFFFFSVFCALIRVCACARAFLSARIWALYVTARPKTTRAVHFHLYFTMSLRELDSPSRQNRLQRTAVFCRCVGCFSL